ncbi:hypothetical protein [Sphingobium sp. Leaf26]|uniref:hypothetical protein n=1 Tax=Sphingobium sp. Leaf26 TaxID=1735693 RepID=UPI0012E2885D|nr:hypothetical protein [Sphingobium sp. Leaf26]
MINLDVVVSIDEPWDAGEALGWPKIFGHLSYDRDKKNGVLRLAEVLSWSGSSARQFDVTLRHEKIDIDIIHSGEEVTFNAFDSLGGVMRFIFGIKKH